MKTKEQLLKEENEELKNKVAKIEYLNVNLLDGKRKAETKLDYVFDKLVDIVEKISEVENDRS